MGVVERAQTFQGEAIRVRVSRAHGINGLGRISQSRVYAHGGKAGKEAEARPCVVIVQYIEEGKLVIITRKELAKGMWNMECGRISFIYLLGRNAKLSTRCVAQRGSR